MGMTVISVTVLVNGVELPLDLRIDDAALTAVVQAVTTPHANTSPYLTIPEAAEYLRCKRQRVDDLLSSRRLTRYKDGRRTLVNREELTAYVEGRRPSVKVSADSAGA